MPLKDSIPRAMVGFGVLAQYTPVLGRRHGQPRTAVINKAPAPGGGWYLAAGKDSHRWFRNLQVIGRCRLRVGGKEAEYVARELTGDEYAEAVRKLAPPFGGDSSRHHRPGLPPGPDVGRAGRLTGPAAAARPRARLCPTCPRQLGRFGVARRNRWASIGPRADCAAVGVSQGRRRSDERRGPATTHPLPPTGTLTSHLRREEEFHSR